MKSSLVQPAARAEEGQTQRTAGDVAFTRRHNIVPPSLTLEGKYSIERMLALEEYTRTKSYWHVLRVVIWTPLVPLLIILVFQLPPLASPDAGFRANWMYVIERGGLGAYMAHEACLVISRGLMPELSPVLLPFRTRIMLGGAFMGVQLCVTAVLATWWGFPVPFSASIVNPICGLTGVTSIYLVVRPILNQSRQLQRRFVTCFIYTSVFSCASLGYPAYIALFVFVGNYSPHYQPLLTLLAVVIKIGLRKIMAYAVREWEDLIPVMVIFSVEFFSSLFQVVAVQASSSSFTTAFIIAFDFASTARSQWKLYKSTESLRLLLQETEAEALLPALANLCKTPEIFQASSPHVFEQLRDINIFSTLRTDVLSTETQRRLEKVHEAHVFSSTHWERVAPNLLRSQSSHGRAATLRSALNRVCVCRSSSKIAAPAANLLPGKRELGASGSAQDKQRTALIEATAMLFRTEVMLLAEYLECIIPFFYAVNMMIVWLSPNALYYPLTRSIKTPDQLVLILVSISVLFAVEMASFVLLNWILWKRLRFSPMHQVGFVMETHASIIRANMLFMLILVIHMNVVHTGADFTFQFKWLRSSSSSNTNT